jgi:hypothetical protein
MYDTLDGHRLDLTRKDPNPAEVLSTKPAMKAVSEAGIVAKGIVASYGSRVCRGIAVHLQRDLVSAFQAAERSRAFAEFTIAMTPLFKYEGLPDQQDTTRGMAYGTTSHPRRHHCHASRIARQAATEIWTLTWIRSVVVQTRP